ncbi:hypothetical protein HBB16_16205 [Pseudonocardia sp. MCCB 268]|nr:hypothetical protein [Pseudonocardia cytotoxica]
MRISSRPAPAAARRAGRRGVPGARAAARRLRERCAAGGKRHRRPLRDGAATTPAPAAAHPISRPARPPRRPAHDDRDAPLRTAAGGNGHGGGSAAGETTRTRDSTPLWPAERRLATAQRMQQQADRGESEPVAARPGGGHDLLRERRAGLPRPDGHPAEHRDLRRLGRPLRRQVTVTRWNRRSEGAAAGSGS